jgi:hypothetical protein
MQYDMHYYGTYAMAAAAGIPQADAEIIATSAQFVDDHNITSYILAKSQEGILGVATAHHPLDAGVRVFFGTNESNDTRLIWVPFHFIPGGDGASFQERMICRKNSPIANALLDYYMKEETLAAHRDHALHLMGIAAHVYADTFSHYGFSGLSNESNQIEAGSIELENVQSQTLLSHISRQADAFMAHFAQAPKLGHGGVLTNPDRPYLKWKFKYQDGTVSARDNPATFLEACKCLYNRFAQFSNLYYNGSIKPTVAWPQVEPAIKAVLATEGAANERVEAWIGAIKAGKLGGIAVPKTYRAETWVEETESFKESDDAGSFLQSNPYRFLAAADYHRNYVLKRLLPQFALMVA